MQVNKTYRMAVLLVSVTIAAIGCNRNPSNNEQNNPAASAAPAKAPSKQAEPEFEQNDTQLSSDKNTIERDLSDEAKPISIDLPAYITGQYVLMRSSYSTQSSHRGTFKQFESVFVLEECEPTNSNEGITKGYVKLYDEYGQHAETLNPRRAVKIIGREGTKYKVSFVSTKRRTLTATIDRSEIEIIRGEKWYRVRRENGKTGWVLSRFVELEAPGC